MGIRVFTAIAAVLLAVGLSPSLASITPGTSISAASVKGVTLDGLQDWLPSGSLFRPNVALAPGRLNEIKAQELAAKEYWHMNLVRFQIIQAKLVSSPVYLSQVREVTNYGLSLGLTIVLNAQTEGAPHTVTGSPLPKRQTYLFWQKLIPYYGDNPHVIFDLFNEPRYCHSGACHWVMPWGMWRAAFQPLVTWVRARARNQIWVEGRTWGSDLGGVPLLRGSNIAYSFHHPGSPWPGSASLGKISNVWNRAFGRLASHGIPVVDGEFPNYSGGYHWAHPQALVPAYLRYLAAHHIGLVVWTLGLPGVLNSTSDLASTTTEPTGDGALVMRYFATH